MQQGNVKSKQKSFLGDILISILGFETVSYLLEGEFIHEDCLGHKGLLKAGDLQWITAGKGIIHSEMPGPIDTRGLQLWVNLKNEHKMVEPKYQELEGVLLFGHSRQ